MTVDGTVYDLPADAIPDSAATTFAVNPGSPQTFGHYLALWQVLMRADPHIDLGHVTRVAISSQLQPNPAYLGGADVQPDSSFADPANPSAVPAVFVNGQGAGTQLNYIRPLRYGSDQNGRDLRSASTDQDLDVEVSTTGTKLDPVVVHAPSHAKVNTPIPISASVGGSGTPPGGLTYYWSFDDGPPRQESGTTSYTYGTTGRYEVAVEVVGDDSFGQSDPVTIQVGNPSTGGDPHHPRGGGNGHRHRPSAGPRRGKGKQVGGRATGRPGAGQTSDGTGGGAGDGTGSTDAPPGGTGSAAASAPAGRTRRHTSHTAPPDAGLVAIDGLALSSPSVSVRPPAAQRRRGKAPTAPAARRASTVMRVGATLVGSVVVLLLLGLGVFGETRSTGRRQGSRRVRRRGLHT